MAPEQIQGGVLTPATDIYSLGVVMHEMLTGERPSRTIVSGSGAPSRPRLAAGLCPKVRRVILRCLEHDPAARFQRASEVVDALNVSRIRYAKPMMAAAALAVFAAGVFAYHFRKTPKVLPKRDGISVAVLGFKDLSGGTQSANLSEALATGLRVELRAVQDVRVVPGEDVSHLRANLKLADSDSYGQETLNRIEANTGADLAVAGSYMTARGESSQGRKIWLYLVAQNTKSGETVATVREEGLESDLPDLFSRSVDTLAADLKLPEPSGESERMARAALPANADALRFYSQGLEARYSFDGVHARRLFEKAIARDPSYAPAHAQLSETLSDLGYQQDALREIGTALELSKGLPREQQLLIQAQYYDTYAQWDKAAEIKEALFRIAPENSAEKLYYGLDLAYVQDPPEILETVRRLRELPMPLREDPRIDIQEAKAAAGLGDFKRQWDAAKRAAEKAEGRSARGQLARALEQQAQAARMLGDAQKAASLYGKAMAIFESLGDRDRAMVCLRGLALLRINAGDLEAAWKINSEALQVSTEMGSPDGQARALDWLGLLRFKEGRLLEGKRLLEQSLAVWRTRNSSLYIGTEEVELSEVALHQANLAECGRLVKDALRVTPGSATNVRADAFRVWAELLLEKGDVKGASEQIGEGLRVQRNRHESFSLEPLLITEGSVLREQGSAAEARQKYTEALNLYTSHGENGGVAVARLKLAELSLDEGDARSAKKLSALARAEFEREGRTSDAGRALAVEALSDMAQHDAAATRTARDELADAGDAIEDRIARDFVRTAAARIAAQGDAPDARTQLESLIVRARRAGMVRDCLEAELALAEIDPHADREQLAAEASRHGFTRLAKCYGTGTKARRIAYSSSRTIKWRTEASARVPRFGKRGGLPLTL